MEEIFTSDENGVITYYANKDEYGGIIQYDSNEKAKHTVYSDRLFGWDSKKYNECCRMIWNNEGQMFYDDRKPEEVQKFLREYLKDESVILCRIIRYKRMDGYSVWRFDYNTEKK